VSGLWYYNGGGFCLSNQWSNYFGCRNSIAGNGQVLPMVGN